MKKAFLVYGSALAIIAGTSLALADHHGGGHQKHRGGDPEQRIQRMQEHLDLSDEQVEQMRAIKQGEGSRAEKREQMRSILSDEQRAVMEEHRARRKEMREQRGQDEGA